MAAIDSQLLAEISLLAVGIVTTATALVKSRVHKQEQKLLPMHDSYKPELISPADPFEDLSPRIINAIHNLEGFQLPDGVLERLRRKFPFNKMSDQELEDCIHEFKKFIIVWLINREAEKTTGMVSKIIDEVWHTFILFTEDYHRFSALMNAEYIHHSPSTKTQRLSSVTVANFYECYRKYFGELSSIWKYRVRESTLGEAESDTTITYELVRPGVKNRAADAIAKDSCTVLLRCGDGTIGDGPMFVLEKASRPWPSLVKGYHAGGRT